MLIRHLRSHLKPFHVLNYRAIHISPRLLQPSPASSETEEVRPNFYRTHGRAFFKAITLAFFSYQVFYWAWLTLETEEIRDQKNREISSLESEVRLLDEGRRSHRLVEKKD